MIDVGKLYNKPQIKPEPAELAKGNVSSKTKSDSQAIANRIVAGSIAQN